MMLPDTKPEEKGIERRDLLKLGALTGAAATVSSMLPKISFGDVKPLTLNQIMGMTPLRMAQTSRIVQAAWQYLEQVPEMIEDRRIRRTVAAILDNPVPTFAANLTPGSQAKLSVYNNLVSKSYLSVSIDAFLPPVLYPVQAFYSAPGSGYGSHHSYPGGLALHTALNLESSLGLFDGYRRINNTLVDRDIVIVSQLLHDQQKPWVFQWLDTGASRPEVAIAGAGEHHIYSIAESIYRGLPADACVAQACAHDNPGTPEEEARVVGYIKAACILLGVDPVAKGLLSASGDTLPLPRRIENYICNLGDHDWVLSVPAAQLMIAEMKEIAKNYYSMSDPDLLGLRFNAFRNYVFSQASILRLYLILSTEGRDALVAQVRQLVRP